MLNPIPENNTLCSLSSQGVTQSPVTGSQIDNWRETRVVNPVADQQNQPPAYHTIYPTAGNTSPDITRRRVATSSRAGYQMNDNPVKGENKKLMPDNRSPSLSKNNVTEPDCFEKQTKLDHSKPEATTLSSRVFDLSINSETVQPIQKPKNKYKESRLTAACREGNIPYLKNHFKYHPYHLHLFYTSGKDDSCKGHSVSLLHTAVMENQLETMTYLISQGIDVNARLSDGKTALILAAANANFSDSIQGKTTLQVFKLLLDHQADPNCKDETNNCALCLIADKGYDQTEYIQAIKLLLEHGYQINVPLTKCNYIFLEWSCIQRNLAVNKLVLKHGADPNLILPRSILPRSSKRITPLITLLSWEYDRTYSLNLFHQHGVKVDITDIDGNSSLHLATKALNTAHVDWLLQHKADANSINQQSGETALHLFAGLKPPKPGQDPKKNKQLKEKTLIFNSKVTAMTMIFEKEIERGTINVNKINEKTGYSILYLAIKTDKQDLAKALIAAGANPHKKEYQSCIGKLTLPKPTTAWSIMTDKQQQLAKHCIDAFIKKKQTSYRSLTAPKTGSDKSTDVNPSAKNG